MIVLHRDVGDLTGCSDANEVLPVETDAVVLASPSDADVDPVSVLPMELEGEAEDFLDSTPPCFSARGPAMRG